MKLLVGTIILGASLSALGQDTAPARIALPSRVATDVIISGPMKQAPFTADESGETVRIMADGNRIVDSWTGKMSRNSQGRIRRDITSGKVGDASARPFIFGGGVGAGVVALGTAEGGNHVLMSKIDAEHAAVRAVLAPAAEGGSGQSITLVRSGVAPEARAVTLAKIEATAVGGEGIILSDRAEAVRVALPTRAEEGKFTTRKESLGTRDFGGISAEGVRVITTFQPGAVGNEREIEVSAETWFSKDLGVIVYSKRIDPRVGETTYQMTNINRVEPDPSLFPGNK
jgi:hypothetical protein